MALTDLADPVVWLVTVCDAGRHGAMIATFVMPATLSAERPRVLAAISNAIATHALIDRSGRFALQLLERSQTALVPRFGLRSRPDGSEWDGVGYRTTASGLRLVDGTCGVAECVVADRMRTGDRTVFLADVVAEEVVAGRAPLRTEEALARQPADAAAALRASFARDVARDDARLGRD